MESTAKLKPYYKIIQKMRGELRSPERLIAHYELERQLSDRLRHASRQDRTHLYTELYSELFAKLPDHPQNIWSPDPRDKRTARKVRLLRPLLTPNSVFLDVGCGDGALAMALSNHASAVIGLDVTDSLVDYASAPTNFRFVKTSGVDIALPDDSVDLVYSNQLMEHLHVEDAEDQLREIIRILKPGGKYLCITPSRVTGPHDVSVYFDDTATGFHMREYDYYSMRSIFLKAGFSRVRFPIVARGHWLATPPYSVLRALEFALSNGSSSLRISKSRIASLLMGITAIGIK